LAECAGLSLLWVLGGGADDTLFTAKMHDKFQTITGSYYEQSQIAQEFEEGTRFF